MNRSLLVFALLVFFASGAFAYTSFDVNILCSNCKNVDLSTGSGNATFDINFINTGDAIAANAISYNVYFERAPVPINASACTPITLAIPAGGSSRVGVSFTAGMPSDCYTIQKSRLESSGGGTIQVVATINGKRAQAFQTATIRRSLTGIPDNTPWAAIALAFLVLAIAMRSNKSA